MTTAPVRARINADSGSFDSPRFELSPLAGPPQQRARSKASALDAAEARKAAGWRAVGELRWQPANSLA